MGLIKLAGAYFSYRKVNDNEKKSLLKQHKRLDGTSRKINAGLSGILGGLAGGAIGHAASGGKGIPVAAGALIGAAGLGSLGYLESKINNEMHEDRLKNSDRKWIVFEPSLRKVVKKYK